MPRLSASIHGHERGGIVVALGIACVAASAFWLPSLHAAHGWFPAPLDDVYIHFDFARALATGHPFEWIPGQGYSSGETAPLYAFVLAAGWLIGFRGALLGMWAGLVAIASVASLLLSVRRLVRPAPAWLAWPLAALPLSVGVVDWTLFSGMEVALFAGVLGRALVALAETTLERRGGATREKRQWRLGAWGVALVLLRPEAALLVAVFAVAAARGVGRRSAIAGLVRTALPGAIATTAVLAANYVATGDMRSAGAQLKLLSSNPYLSEVDRARAFVENLVAFWMRVVRRELSYTPRLSLVLPLLALGSLLRREHRTVGGACVISAIAWTLLVSWNGNSPFHNFRYYVPALVLLTIAAALAIASFTAHAKGLAPLGAVLGAVTFVLAAARIPGQVKYFRDATANIRDQQIEVGERISRLPVETRVLLGDAGAIPYVSRRPAVDALGLGGYRRVPFAHAAVHGEAATIELIERLDPIERPTHLAMYPNWFALLTSRFGVELDRVTIENNVICGGPTKGIYRADWSPLGASPDNGSARIVDEIDVADVISEAEHGYAAPLPHGGWTTLDILVDESRARRFDGGRIIPHGKTESFTVRKSANGPLTIRVRIDAGARDIVLRTSHGSQPLTLEPIRGDTWRSATAPLESIAAGDVLTLEASTADYRDYHVWIERPAEVSR